MALAALAISAVQSAVWAEEVEVATDAVPVVAIPADAPGLATGAAAPTPPLETGPERGAGDTAAVTGDPDAPAAPESPYAPVTSYRPIPRETWMVPAMRWDNDPRGARWTAAVMAALRGPGAPLMDVVPRDIADWCPGYPQADRDQRAAFWAGLVSTLAWHESTFRPQAVGGNGRWFGLVQIAPGTARWRNCDVQSGEALLDGAANLRCGIRIMGITVPRDRVVSEGMRGVAADWGPFHSQRKREDMRTWVRSQDYCQRQLVERPVRRPDGLGPLDTDEGESETGPEASAAAGPRAPRPDTDLAQVPPRPVMRPLREDG